MHLTRVTLKTGEQMVGNVWSVRIQDGWFTLIVGDDEHTIKMADCKSVVTEGERISRTNIGDQDMLAEWSKRAAEEAAYRERRRKSGGGV